MDVPSPLQGSVRGFDPVPAYAVRAFVGISVRLGDHDRWGSRDPTLEINGRERKYIPERVALGIPRDGNQVWVPCPYLAENVLWPPAGPQRPLVCVPCKAHASPRGGKPRPAKLSLQPEALGAVQEVTNGLKHSEKRISLEIQRAARAAT